MKHKIIVDTSAWIEYFKNNTTFVKFIEENLYIDSIFITGPIISELLQGTKTEKELDLLLYSIKAVPFIECSYDDWVSAGQLSFNLRKNGKIIPLTDLLIAVIALKNDAKVLTLDNHFKEIPKVKLIEL